MIFAYRSNIYYVYKSHFSFSLLCAKRQSNGRRISCKKRESRKAFELRRQLNSHVGRRCAPDNRRRFRRPLNGRAASVQHSLNLHCCKGNVRLKRVLWQKYFFYKMRFLISFFFQKYSFRFFKATLLLL